MTVPRYMPRGGGGGSPAAQAPVGQGTATDPNDILTAYAVNGLFTEMELEDPTTVSPLPDAGASFSTDLQDMFGVVRSFILGDLIQLRLWSEDALLPTDTCIWAAVTVGALSGTSVGFGIRIDNNGGLMRISHLINAGASWAATPASVSHASVRGGCVQIVPGTTASSGRVNASAFDAAGLLITVGNVGSANAAATGWAVASPATKLSWGGGWMTGAGGSGGSVIKLSPRLAFLKLGVDMNL